MAGGPVDAVAARRQIAVFAQRAASMANMSLGAANRRGRGGVGEVFRKLSKPMADLAAERPSGASKQSAVK